MSTVTITFAVREGKSRTSGEAPIDYNLFLTMQHFSKSAKKLIVRFLSGQNKTFIGSFSILFVPYFQIKLLYLSRKERKCV